MDASAAMNLKAPLHEGLTTDSTCREPGVETDVEARAGGTAFNHLLRQISSRSEGGQNASFSESVSMEWKDVCFSIKDKQILKNITGMMAPGHLTAVLGPSGSGKSTLLNILGGRQRTTNASGSMPMTGEVSVSGREIDLQQFKSNIAYVMQDDRLMGTETVRECIEFSALLRRPGTVAERAELVEHMLHTLGLTKCADTIAGNALLKGISGGERKRTSVGIELITDPKMLFLDEPLSGLDSYAAYTLVQALKELAQAGVPVLCTVHQPSSEIFAMFDDCVILHDGEVVYHGPVETLAHHFGRWDKCPANFNPADHVMFMLQKDAEENQTRIREMKDYWTECALGKDLRDRVDRKRASNASTPLALRQLASGSRLGFCSQLVVLTRREARGTLRNKGVLMARCGMSMFLALMYAWLFAGSADKDDKHCANAATQSIPCTSSFQAHYGTLVSLSIATMMGAAQPILLQFPAERPVFLREYCARQYGVVPYFLSKSIVELPVVAFTQVLTYLIAYWVMGLQGNFLWLIVVAWSLGITSSSLSLVIGCGVASAEKAIQFAPLALVPQMLFSGLFVPVSKIPDSLQWVKYLCPLKYAINLATLIEFQDVKDHHDECLKHMTPECAGAMPGMQVRLGLIDAQGTSWDDVWLDTALLAGLYVLFRVISCILLWRKGRYIF